MTSSGMTDIVFPGGKIGPGASPFIVAEISCNHNQSLDRALEIVEASAQAGAHAVKIQTSTPDTMTLDLADGEFVIRDEKSLWNGRTLYDLYKEAYTPWEWHKPIFDRCRELGVVGFSTPFSLAAVDFLETLHVPLYKIASFENVDIPLIKRAAKTGKPLIISTGMATAAELDEAVSAARGAGCRDLVLLKCTSTYPAPPDDINLLTIPEMKSRFGCHVGLSDHTLGIGVGVAAVTLGAVFVEKHVTLSRSDGGLDSAFSMEPDELRLLVTETAKARLALGHVSFGPTEKEKKSLQFRRSLYVVRDMQAGDVFTEENLKSIRPGRGLPPKFYDELLGKKVLRAVKRGTPVSLDMIATLSGLKDTPNGN